MKSANMSTYSITKDRPAPCSGIFVGCDHRAVIDFMVGIDKIVPHVQPKQYTVTTILIRSIPLPVLFIAFCMLNPITRRDPIFVHSYLTRRRAVASRKRASCSILHHTDIGNGMRDRVSGDECPPTGAGNFGRIGGDLQCGVTGL